MKILSMWEPWSTLLARGNKKVETRGWHTDYTGPVAIHSCVGGLSLGELETTCYQEHFFEALERIPEFAEWNARKPETMLDGNRPTLRKADIFPFGHIIAVGMLLDCLPAHSNGCMPGVFEDWPDLDTPAERAFGNYEPGRFGLVFEKMFRLPAPIRYRSKQGKLLDIEPRWERLVREQWTA